MRTGTVEKSRTRIVLIGNESPYAYGDSSEPDTHTGIDQSLTVCIMYSCAYGKFGIRSPYVNNMHMGMAVCIWGTPYAYGQGPLGIRIRGVPVRIMKSFPYGEQHRFDEK